MTGTASLAARARARAAVLARSISLHHQRCKTCQQGGRLQVGRGGIHRGPCELEAALFGQLAACQREGWR